MNIKKLTAILAVIAMLCTVVLTAGAQEQKTVLNLQIGSPYMTVNGQESEIDPRRGTVPVVESGRTLVPIRAIIEALGGTVGWDGEKAEVTLTYGEDVIKLVIGSDVASLNGVETKLDVAPQTINERTMLPIRYIAESFKFTVGWDGSTSTVTITKEQKVQSESTTTSTDVRDDDFDVHDNPEDTIEEKPVDETEEIDPEDEEDMYAEDEEDTEIYE